MEKETRSKKEIDDENKKMYDQINQLSMKLHTAYRKDEEALKRIKEIIGTILDQPPHRDYDPKQGESRENALQLLGITEDEDKENRAGALVLNMRFKRCLREIEEFRSERS